MTSFYTKSFSYISDHKEAATIVAFLTSTRPFFHSSVVPVTLGDDEKLFNIIASSRTIENNLLQLFSLSQTMQFTQKIHREHIVQSTPDDEFHANILRHLIKNTRYFCRSLKELTIPPAGKVFSLVTNPATASSLVALENLALSCSHSEPPVDADFFAHIANLSTSLRNLNNGNIVTYPLNLFSRVTDADLAPISKLVHLSYLRLYSAKSITGSGLCALASLKNLRTLILLGCPQIDDEGLENGLAKVTSLTDVSLGSSLITDKGLEQVLMSLDLLRVLRLIYCQKIEGKSLAVMSSASIEKLELMGLKDFCAENCFETISALPRLQILRLQALPKFSDKGLELLAKNKTPLTELRVSMCAGLSEDGAKYLGEMTSLTTLHVLESFSTFTNAALSHISKLTSSLTELDLSELPGITDISRLKLLTRLKCLYCTDCPMVYDASVVQLLTEGSFDSLKNLSLNGCEEVTDASLDVICSKLTTLTYLSLGGLPLITDAGARKIISLTHLRYLDLKDCDGLEHAEETMKYITEKIPGL